MLRVSGIEAIMLSNSSFLDSIHTLSTAATIGRTAPLGATITRDGVNFSVFSRKATAVEILFFDREDDAKPADLIRMDPATSRTYH
jgi:isoamylase